MGLGWSGVAPAALRRYAQCMPKSPATQRRAGRGLLKRPLLTAPMAAAVRHAKRGYPDKLIAALSGVHPTLLRDWLRQGNTDAADEILSVEAEFFLEYTAARAVNAAAILTRQNKHAIHDFRANQWLFNVLHPDLMPDPAAVRVKVTAVPVDLSDLDEEQLKQLAGIEG